MGRARLGNLFDAYRLALTEEPRMRAYVVAAFVDDVGVAVSVWASQLLMTNVFVDQRTRAHFMMPMLLCFIVGSIVAGPLADRSGVVTGGAASPGAIARWRHRLIAFGRAVETTALAVFVVLLARGGPPTMRTVLPYFLVAAFMKTALRPARIAFEADLLVEELPQLDAGGQPLADEVGQPLHYKRHLLTFTALLSFLNVGATFCGLLAGGKLLELAVGDFWKVYACDVATNVIFLAVFVGSCRPLGQGDDRTASGPRLRTPPLRDFFGSLRAALGFLRSPAQRPLLCLLAGGWMVEVATEFYDGKMILKHVFPGTDDNVRHAQIAWSLVSLGVLAGLPALAARVGRLGRIFLATMLLDGLAIAVAGRVAMAPVAAAIGPFVGALALDRALTDTSGTLMTLAQISACRAEMRGRVAATYAFVVLVSDVVAEGVATAASDSIGIPRMLVAVGLAQVALMAVVAGIGGRALWNFGLHARAAEPRPARAATR
jgi:hypothetical protein